MDQKNEEHYLFPVDALKHIAIRFIWIKHETPVSGLGSNGGNRSILELRRHLILGCRPGIIVNHIHNAYHLIESHNGFVLWITQYHFHQRLENYTFL